MCMLILCYLLCTLSIELKWSLKSRGCRTRININMHWINWVKNYKIIHSYVLYISHSVIFFFWYFDRSKFDLYCLPLVSGDATWFCSFAVNEDLENQTCWQAQQCKCSVGWFHSNDNHFFNISTLAKPVFICLKLRMLNNDVYWWWNKFFILTLFCKFRSETQSI